MPANQDDREVLKEILHRLRLTNATTSNGEVADAILEVGFTRSAKDEGWIACSERMPDTPKTNIGEFTVLLNGEEVTHGWLTEGEWLILDAECFEPIERVPPAVCNCVVTHWRPLPAPPPTQADAGEGAAGVEG